MANYDFWSRAWIVVTAVFVGGFALTFFVMELDSIFLAWRSGQRASVWTYSDFIRRWVAPHRWVIAAIVGILAAVLWVHFFVQTNPV